jgi:hypothetical protein
LTLFCVMKRKNKINYIRAISVIKQRSQNAQKISGFATCAARLAAMLEKTIDPTSRRVKFP